MWIILAMSLSGSVVIVAILLMNFLLGKETMLRWKMIWIKTSLALFLFPVPLLKEEIADFLSTDAEVSQNFHLNDGERFLVFEDRAVIVSHREWGQIWLLGAVLLVAAVFLVRNCQRYFRVKRCTRLLGEIGGHLDWKEEIEELKSQLKIKRKIRVYMDPYDRTAFTTGVMIPIVIAPETLGKDRRYVVLMHELIHIKKLDSFWKVLVSIVICMHWYNPLVFLLPVLYDELCELRCDGTVLKYLNTRQKRIYAEEILNQSLRKNDRVLYEMPLFSRGRKMTEVRIMNIRNKTDIRETLKRWKAAGILLSIAIGIACYIPVQAYEKPTVLHVNSSRNEGVIVGSMEFTFRESGLEEIIAVTYDNQFTDENGMVYDAKNWERKNCSHPSKVPGEYQVHRKNNDGGCDIYIYSALRCKDCGIIFEEELVSSHHYEKCPHG